MRVLVTGGAGFIGSHVVDRLEKSGVETAVLDTVPPGRSPWAGTTAPEWIEGDVRDEGAVARALEGVDAVCHQAAMVGLGKGVADAPPYVSVNDLGTAVLLRGMTGAGVRDLVLAGSMVVYGEGDYRCADHGTVRPPARAAADLAAGRFEPGCPECGARLLPSAIREGAPTEPRSVYAVTKLAQEQLAAVWADSTGGRAISLRYHNVYGDGMPKDTPYAGVASFFRSALERGEAPRVFEDGGQRRDFVHVEDVASANETALRALPDLGDGRTRAYNTGSGEPHTIGEMATALASAYGGPQPVVTGEYRLGDVRHITASSERIATELGWRAEVSFAEGMRRFAAEPLAG